MAYFIYILECTNDAYYTGYTLDIKRRYQEHSNGSEKCKYTRSFPPRRLVACWTVTDLSLAMQIERTIKLLSKKQKFNLIQSPTTLVDTLLRKGYHENIGNFIAYYSDFYYSAKKEYPAGDSRGVEGSQLN